MYKSPAEIALMQQAKSMTLLVHQATARIVRKGITTTEVINFIEAAHRKLGAAGNSFVIVQFGRATAYPHGLPGVQTLRENDLILVDTGCYVQGYTSDITRTYSFGEPTPEQRRIWEIEKEAQAAAFAAVEVGKPCESVDYAARAVLEKHGLGPDYNLPGTPHRTGHGIGLSIHEPAYLVRGDRTPLAPGMCFSNEPMIVMPDAFGVRLEDHMYVTDNGATWFTEPQPAIDRLIT
jgi:Xaa-Pro dipeptidase